MLDLFDLLSIDNQGKRHPFKLEVKEDNQACITVAKAGYSQKQRDFDRIHADQIQVPGGSSRLAPDPTGARDRVKKVNLGSLKEVFDRPEFDIDYVDTTEQAADIFTKALAPL